MCVELHQNVPVIPVIITVTPVTTTRIRDTNYGYLRRRAHAGSALGSTDRHLPAPARFVWRIPVLLLAVLLVSATRVYADVTDDSFASTAASTADASHVAPASTTTTTAATSTATTTAVSPPPIQTATALDDTDKETGGRSKPPVSLHHSNANAATTSPADDDNNDTNEEDVTMTATAAASGPFYSATEASIDSTATIRIETTTDSRPVTTPPHHHLNAIDNTTGTGTGTGSSTGGINHPTISIPQWAIVLLQASQRLEHIWTLLIVPVYTIAVVCYLLLALIIRRRHMSFIPDWLERRLQRHSNRVLTGARSRPAASIHHSPNSSATLRPVPAPLAPIHTGTLQDQPIDLTGSYQLVSSTNVDAFLAAQGVPWALRRIATAAMPIHHLTHSGHTLHIKIEAPGSGFTTQTVYQINGPPVETNVRGRLFRDSIRYLYITPEAGASPDAIVEGIVTEKVAILEGYVVTVKRRLNTDRSKIHLLSSVTFPNDPSKQSVESSQVFQRIQ